MPDVVRRRPYCSQPPRRLPVLPPDMPAARQHAIVVGRAKWVNGTPLRYAFLPRTRDHAQEEVVREAFDEWKDLGIGLDFWEVQEPGEAQVRIGFRPGRSWSFVGRDILAVPPDQPTMNFGWDLRTEYGRTTALHEIGHTLGLPHEHQNPDAGLRWDEPALHRFLAGPPNFWEPADVLRNVLRPLEPAAAEAGHWDPDSIMGYEFPPGLVIAPEEYRTGIEPPGTISKLDAERILFWYPPCLQEWLPRLEEFESRPLTLAPGEQYDAELLPEQSRTYRVGVFGAADVVLVLFEDVDGELRQVGADDDSGEDRNAVIEAELRAGRRYVVRARMYHAWQNGTTAVMYW
ncbi:M12 family metallopeptidase [Actinoplanes sp. NPDC023936]|uniref:M12 family metallopeptidase n=1 Tax=Actinoplanes sp. NPDC023936 TaxID=3154910 RepID=UPI0033FFECC4